jgi:hypothetical protein
MSEDREDTRLARARTLRDQAAAIIAAVHHATSDAEQLCHDATALRARTTRERRARHSEHDA